MNILIIDGQGGKIGRELAEGVQRRFPDLVVTLVGTNSLATETMMKSGIRRAATGENAVICACRTADVILGPLGIVIADALLGEISPAMAVAVGQAQAIRILLPMNLCDNIVAGTDTLPVSRLISDALNRLEEIVAGAKKQGS
jgi:hypothetical protein